MSVEDRLFRLDFYYDKDKVERWIDIIQTTDNPHRRKRFKDLVFKMMKDIVLKNVGNYINLMNGSNLDVPDRGEIIADCYMIYDKCLEKYKTHEGYNFYFYLNKSLTRNLYTACKTMQMENNANQTTYVEDITIYSSRVTVDGIDSSTDLLVRTLGFTEVEERVCRSKILGLNSVDFLKENRDITRIEYQRAIQRIKIILTKLKNRGEL